MHGPIYTLVLLSVVGSNSCSMVPFTPCTCVCFGVKSMVQFTPCTCDQIHGPIYIQPVLVIKSMVSFTPRICVCCGVKSMVPFTPCTCVYYGVKLMLPFALGTFVCCGVKSMVPFTPCTCVYCGVKSMVPFTPCTCVCFGVKSMVRFTPCTCDQIHGSIYTQPILVIKSMVPFTPCICVCCGVKCMVPFTPLYFCLLWGQTHAPWFHLHPVLVSVLGSNPRSDLLPVLVIKSMVPLHPACTCDQIHGLIYTLYM